MSTRRGPKPANPPPPKPALLMLDESTWGPADPDDEILPHVAPPPRRWGPLMLTLGLVLALVAGALGWVLFVMPAPAPRRAPWAGAAQGAAPTATPRPPVRTPAPAAPGAPAAPAAVVAATGRLVVSASPWAELYVDGRLVGNTPVIDLPVTAGTHRLRLVRQGFAPDERVVTVTAGETLRVTGIRLRGARR